MPFPVDSPAAHAARQIVGHLRQARHEAYWVGGCVRDALLGRTPKDYDIATSAHPEEIQRLFPDHAAIGAQFGVVQVHWQGVPVEVATFRRDSDYPDGRRPAAVAYCSAMEDARRRDFTINALFYDPEEDRIMDWVGGRADLAARMIRAVGVPGQRFLEDHLRMFRAVRFAATLDFSIEPATFAAIQQHAHLAVRVSPERIQQELSRLLLEAARAGDGLCLLQKSGLLACLLPEVAAMVGQEQPPQFHPEGDVFTHTVLMLNAMRKPTLALALAVLLHDVGKPATAERTMEPDGSERVRFNLHAQRGAEITRGLLERLRYPRQVVEDACRMVAQHMRFMDVKNMRIGKLRQLVGAPTFPDELVLHRLDCACSHGDQSNADFLVDFQAQLRQEPALPPPWINGRDLLALGVPQSPAVGRWLRLAYDAQLEGVCPDRAALLAWVAARIAAGSPGEASASTVVAPAPADEKD